jgi:hypothetical protein
LVAAGQVSLAGTGSGTDRRCLRFLRYSFPSASTYNVRPWLRSGLLDNAYVLVSFVSLKSHNLLWTERWERLGLLIVI